jgi:hypothetical protein
VVSRSYSIEEIKEVIPEEGEALVEEDLLTYDEFTSVMRRRFRQLEMYEEDGERRIDTDELIEDLWYRLPDKIKSDI